MKVVELIKLLGDFNDDAEVDIHDDSDFLLEDGRAISNIAYFRTLSTDKYTERVSIICK